MVHHAIALVSWLAILQKLQLLPIFAYFTFDCRNFHIRTLNRAILVSMESPQSLECAHVNEGAMEGHHTDERITCLLQLHDDFADFSSISLISTQWLA